jgi:predicted PurR-regulated permease PerM
MPVSYNSKPFPVTPNDRGRPSTDQHQDEALALARADRSPAAAFVALALAVASLALLWFGRALLAPALCVAVVAMLASALASRVARRRRRPSGVALAAFIVGLFTAVVVVLLWS